MIDNVFNHITLLCLNRFISLLILIWYYLIHYCGCNLFNLFIEVGYRLYNLNYTPTTLGVYKVEDKLQLVYMNKTV
jgi:hypothetical protein